MNHNGCCSEPPRLASMAWGRFGSYQLSSYRLWAYVGDSEFRSYHQAWWQSIWGVILAPAVLLLIGALLMLWWRAPGVPGWATWLGAVLQIVLVLGTAAWWGPLMAVTDDNPLDSRRHCLGIRGPRAVDAHAKCVARNISRLAQLARSNATQSTAVRGTCERSSCCSAARGSKTALRSTMR
jgi:hypothetical protein